MWTPLCSLKSKTKFFLQLIGFNPKKFFCLRHYWLLKKQKNEWVSQGGKINRNNIILSDYDDNAGSDKGHYFHQDLLVANFIFENSPHRHVDVGSRLDGFVAHVASFREVEVIDIRPLPKSKHQNILFRQADLMISQDIGKTDSLSCLHAIEHFGLGRYTDPINVNGHIEGINNLVDLVNRGGRLYISFPIGLNDEVHFNAHRIFHPLSILSIPSIKNNMNLIRFDYVDDHGDLNLDVEVQDAVGKNKFGCGIYTFEKIT